MTVSMTVQFPTPGKGDLSSDRNKNSAYAATLNPQLPSTTVVTPATPVSIVSNTGANSNSPILVAPVTSDSTAILGFAIAGYQTDNYVPGNRFDVAVGGMEMIMEASVAMSAGTIVGCTYTSDIQIKPASGDSDSVQPIGILLNAAVNAGDKVRVLITTPNI
jgi:hypothetical protein